MEKMNLNDLTEKIRKIIFRITEGKVKEISQDVHLYRDLGIDSIKGIELAVAIQEELGIQIDDSKINQLTTLKLIVEEVNRILK